MIRTLDRIIYEVDSLDTIYTSLWLSVSEVVGLGGSRMLNLDQSDGIANCLKEMPDLAGFGAE